MQIRLITIINTIKYTFNLGHLRLLKNLFRTIQSAVQTEGLRMEKKLGTKNGEEIRIKDGKSN